MSKKLVAIHNHTDQNLTLSYVASGKAVIAIGMSPNPPLGRGNHAMNLEIPDNSDCKKYFATNHIYLELTDPVTKKARSFGFWDDDWNDYTLKFCEGRNWQAGFKTMRGGDQGGNRDNVILKISEHPETPGEIELTAVTLTDLEQKKSIAKAFLTFAEATKISKNDKDNHEKIIAYMQRPDFQNIREKCAEAGYKSIGITFGSSESLVVGREYQRGIVKAIEPSGSYYLMVSKAITFGVQEGIASPIGLLMSKEPAAQMSGYSFFGELALGMAGVGIGGVAFTTFSGYHGFQILWVGGIEEIEIAMGIDKTEVKEILR